MTSEQGTWLVTIIFQMFCPLYRGPILEVINAIGIEF